MVSRLLSLISGGYIIQSESTGGRQTQNKSAVVNPMEKDGGYVTLTIWLIVYMRLAYHPYSIHREAGTFVQSVETGLV